MLFPKISLQNPIIAHFIPPSSKPPFPRIPDFPSYDKEQPPLLPLSFHFFYNSKAHLPIPPHPLSLPEKKSPLPCSDIPALLSIPAPNFLSLLLQ